MAVAVAVAVAAAAATAAAAAACVKSVEGRGACEGRPRPPGPPGPPAHLQGTQAAPLRSASRLRPAGASRRSRHIWRVAVTAPSAHPGGSLHTCQGRSCLPGGEAGAPVAPTAIHALLHVALAGAALPKGLLSQALWGAQGRATACHARHHSASRGAPCRAHGAPQNLQESENHRRRTAQPFTHYLMCYKGELGQGSGGLAGGARRGLTWLGAVLPTPHTVVTTDSDPAG